MKKIIIGTRASQLALWQANHVKGLIETKFNLPVELKKISTKGDQIQDRSLMDIGGKGLFLKEIEDELLAGTVDIAVHSMKDVPYDLPDRLTLAAILRREDPTDAFVSNKYQNIESLPDGSLVGTSSLRRMVQLKQRLPHLKFENLRGNVDTRLRKLDEGQFDAIILATAGLKRLGFAERIKQRLEIVPSVGQGAVGIECRDDQKELLELISKLNHKDTADAVHLERCFSRLVEGTCQTPVGCHVEPDQTHSEKFNLRCFKANPDGSNIFSKELSGLWSDGERLIAELISAL